MSPIAAIRRRLAREETGFTLVELLAAISIGTVITLAAFGLLDASVKAFKKSDDRVDVTQRGRGAMDLLSQKLRSQTCGWIGSTKTSTPPIAQATATSISFWVDTTPQRTALSTDVNANKKLVGFEFSGNNLYSLSYAGDTITSTVTKRIILQNVAPAIDAGYTTAFSYSKYNPSYDRDAATGAANSNLYIAVPTVPVPATDLDDIIGIDVAFRAYPMKGVVSSKNAATFTNEFNSRVSDMYAQSGPIC